MFNKERNVKRLDADDEDYVPPIKKPHRGNKSTDILTVSSTLSFHVKQLNISAFLAVPISLLTQNSGVYNMPAASTDGETPILEI